MPVCYFADVFRQYRWYKPWVEARSPSSGVLFQFKRRAHRRYKYAVHQARRKQDYIRRSRMAETLLNIPNRNFWVEVHWVCGNPNAASAPLINNVSGPENIANLWMDRFKELYNLVDGLPSMALLCDLAKHISSFNKYISPLKQSRRLSENSIAL